MKDKCDYCEIRRNCDWLAEMCRLSDREVAQRPHLIFGRTDKQRAATETLRKQKRDYQRRVRAMRREQIPLLRVAFSRLLDEYGTFGKHQELMQTVRQRRREIIING